MIISPSHAFFRFPNLAHPCYVTKCLPLKGSFTDFIIAWRANWPDGQYPHCTVDLYTELSTFIKQDKLEKH